MGRRVFLVSGARLDAYHWKRGRSEAPLRFEAGERGLADFTAYLERVPPDPVYLLVDFVEEEFREDTIPRTFGPERRALIHARRRRLFPNLGYGCAVFQGREVEGRRDDRMLFTALTRPDRLAPWVERVARRRVPLAGVYSLPLLTGQMLKRIPVDASHALVVTWQSAGGLRQTFFHKRRLKLSRLAVSPRVEPGEDAVCVQAEVEKLRRYLGRQGLLAPDHPLDVYVIADLALLKEIRRLPPASSEVRRHLVPLPELAARLGIKDAPDLACCDPLFVGLLARRTPPHQYAPARQIRDFSMHRTRSGLRAASLLLAAAGALGGGAGFVDGVIAARDTGSLRTQADLYRQRYARARERLPPTPVDLPAMQRAVEWAEGLRDSRTSPVPVYHTLSRGLRLHPRVRIESIDWSAEAGADPALHAREPAGAPSEPRPGSDAPLPGGGVYHSADVHGRIDPFGGDYRDALEQVGGFAESLRRLPGVVEVGVLSLPLDIGSGASLSGDAGARAAAAEAPFAIRLLMHPHSSALRAAAAQ